MNDIYIPIFLLLISAIFSSLIFPRLNFFAMKLGITDKPNERKQHKRPMVHIGGFGMILTFITVISIFFFFLKINLDYAVMALFVGSIYFFLIGFLDDLLTLSPFLRLFFQFLGSTFIWNLGIKLTVIDFSWFKLFPTIIYLPEIFSLFFTSFIIVGVINAINWLDGLDGLATGSILISALGLAALFLLSNNYECLIFTSILIGICIGFLNYNYYPAKLIMGDGGSYFLGFYIIYLVIFSALDINASFAKNIFLPLLMIGIPIIDMALVLLTRINNRKSVFAPDRSHIHHRLLDSGISHRNSVLIIYSLSQWSVCLALFFTEIYFKNIIFILSSFLLFSTLYYYFKINNLTRK